MSRANNVVLKVRDLKSTSEAKEDSYSSQAWLADKYGDGATDGAGDVNQRATSIEKVNGTLKQLQVQLGSQFMPSKPIDNLPEAIHSALKTFGGMRRTDTSIGLTVQEFAGEETAAYASGAVSTPNVAFTPSIGIMAIPLESSSTLQQSGAAINAQRTAVVNVQLAKTDRFRRVDLFVEYTKLATLMLDSVIVRS
jgi:hypothetical protein